MNQSNFSRHRSPLLFLVSAILALSSAAFAQDSSTALSSPDTLPLQPIGPGLFQLGTVRLDKSGKTIQFPAVLNMTDGLIEYLLVTSKGKSYESLLTTDAEPYHIHLAMLLLGAKGAPLTAELSNAPAVPFHVNRPPNATNLPPLPPITGDRISVQLTWLDSGQFKTAPIEDWLIDLSTKTNASRGPWLYNGSRLLHSGFQAQREGNIIAVIDDMDAMVNNPRAGHDNDQIWQINTNALPPAKTPVQVTFKLEPAPANP